MNALKSKAFKRAENSLLNKLNAAFLKNYPHHVMPGYNLNISPCIDKWDEESAMGLYQEFPYNCDLPKPLLPPAKLSRTGNCNIDMNQNLCLNVFFSKLLIEYILKVLYF